MHLPIVVLAAPLSSGKTTVCEYLRTKNFVGIEVPRYVYHLLNMDFRKRNVPRLMWIPELIDATKKAGVDTVASSLLEELYSMYNSDVKGFVLCGLRDIELLKAIQSKHKKLINIVIKTEIPTAFAWSKERMDNRDPVTIDEYSIVVESEIKYIENMSKVFNFIVINNNSTLECLFQQIDDILDSNDLVTQ